MRLFTILVFSSFFSGQCLAGFDFEKFQRYVTEESASSQEKATGSNLNQYNWFTYLSSTMFEVGQDKALAERVQTALLNKFGRRPEVLKSLVLSLPPNTARHFEKILIGVMQLGSRNSPHALLSDDRSKDYGLTLTELATLNANQLSCENCESPTFRAVLMQTLADMKSSSVGEESAFSPRQVAVFLKTPPPAALPPTASATHQLIRDHVEQYARQEWISPNRGYDSGANDLSGDELLSLASVPDFTDDLLSGLKLKALVDLYAAAQRGGATIMDSIGTNIREEAIDAAADMSRSSWEALSELHDLGGESRALLTHDFRAAIKKRFLHSWPKHNHLADAIDKGKSELLFREAFSNDEEFKTYLESANVNSLKEGMSDEFFWSRMKSDGLSELQKRLLASASETRSLSLSKAAAENFVRFVPPKNYPDLYIDLIAHSNPETVLAINNAMEERGVVREWTDALGKHVDKLASSSLFSVPESSYGIDAMAHLQAANEQRPRSERFTKPLALLQAIRLEFPREAALGLGPKLSPSEKIARSVNAVPGLGMLIRGCSRLLSRIR